MQGKGRGRKTKDKILSSDSKCKDELGGKTRWRNGRSKGRHDRKEGGEGLRSWRKQSGV